MSLVFCCAFCGGYFDWEPGIDLGEPKSCPCCGKRLQIKHEASIDCWCAPEVAYTDPETGVSVVVHRDKQ